MSGLIETGVPPEIYEVFAGEPVIFHEEMLGLFLAQARESTHAYFWSPQSVQGLDHFSALVVAGISKNQWKSHVLNTPRIDYVRDNSGETVESVISAGGVLFWYRQDPALIGVSLSTFQSINLNGNEDEKAITDMVVNTTDVFAREAVERLVSRTKYVSVQALSGKKPL